MTIPLFMWIFFFLVGVPTIAGVILLFAVSGKTYVLQPDGHSAKLGVYPICLAENGIHRIWIRMVKDDALVETVHDYIPVEKRDQVWANNHPLRFTYKDGDVIVSWGKELAVIH